MQNSQELIDKKKAELVQALKTGQLSDPFTATILGSALLAHIVGAAALAAAAAAASYGISKLTAGRQTAQQIGLMRGTVNLQNSGQGYFIPYIFGGPPVVATVSTTDAAWTGVVHSATGGSGSITKNSGTDRVFNAGGVIGPITDQDALIKFVANVGDRQEVAVGFSATNNPLPSSPVFWPDPPRPNYSPNVPSYEAGLIIARVARGLDDLGNVIYDNTITPVVNGQNAPNVGNWVAGDTFQIERRGTSYHFYHNFGEISKVTLPTPLSTLYIAVSIWSTGAGLTSASTRVGDIGLPPSAGSGGCKVPAIIDWAVKPLKHVQTVSQPSHGGKGHPSPTTAQQVFYTIDLGATFAQGSGGLDLLREYGNTDILLNFDPILLNPSGVYDPTLDDTTAQNPSFPPSPLAPDLAARVKNQGELALDPIDPIGGGQSGPIQQGASSVAWYPGSMTQLTDPTEEADVDAKNGIGSTTAHRGKARIAHTGLDLSKWQGIPPNLTAVWSHRTLKTLASIYPYLCNLIVDENNTPLLDSGDYDFSSLTIASRGMLIDGRRFGPAEVIDNADIQDVYNYFCTEGDGKILGYMNGSEPALTIPWKDIGWLAADAQIPDVFEPLQVSLADETKLPREVDIKYINPGDDWDQGSQSAQRKVTLGNTQVTMQVSLTLNPDEARTTAFRRLYRQYIEGTLVKFTLSFKYAYIYPGYKITTISPRGMTYVMRLTSKTGGLGIQDCEGFLLEAAAFSQANVGHLPPDYNPGQVIPAPTILAAMDLPKWRTGDTPSVLGMDFGGTPRDTSTQSYGGFTLCIKRGTNWVPIGTLTGQATLGKIVSATGLGTDPNVTDLVGQIVVDLYGTSQALISVSESDMLVGANRACAGDMIIGFANAVRINDGSPNRWLLSTLRLGQNNTVSSIGSDLTNRNFAVLDDSIKFIELDPYLDLTPNQVHLKPVSLGASVSDTTEVITTMTGRSLKGPLVASLICIFSSLNADALFEYTRVEAKQQSQHEVYDFEIRNVADTATLRTIVIKPTETLNDRSTPPITPVTGGILLPLGRYTYPDEGSVSFMFNPHEHASNKAWLRTATSFSPLGGWRVECQIAPDRIFPKFFTVVPFDDGDGLGGFFWLRMAPTIFDPLGVNYISAEGISPGYPVTPGDRLSIVGQPNGTVSYYINQSPSTYPIYVSANTADFTKLYKANILETPDSFDNSGFVQFGVNHVQWTRQSGEFSYKADMQTEDYGSLPTQIRARIRQRSLDEFGLAGDWLNVLFTRP